MTTDDDHQTLCPDCAGSGEGLSSGSRCRACAGTGDAEHAQRKREADEDRAEYALDRAKDVRND